MTSRRTARHDFSLWHNRDFVLLASGQSISQFGSAITTFTIPWLLLQLTGSGSLTGIAFAVGFVPYLLVSLPAGAVADRINRRHLMIMADFVRLVCIAAIPVSHMVFGQVLWPVLLIVQAVMSFAAAFFDAAYGACMPNIVSKSDLKSANAAMQMGSSLSRIVGPLIAGVLVISLGAANTVTLDATSFLVSIVSLLTIRASFQATTTAAAAPSPAVGATASISKPLDSAPQSKRHLLHDIREGLRYIGQSRIIRTLALFSALINLVGPGMDVALLYRLQHELSLPSLWAGAVMMGLSGGMFAGGFAMRWIGRLIPLGWLLAASTMLQAIPPFVLAFARAPMLLIAIQVTIGVLLVVWNVQSVTLRQSLIPDSLLGRCTSVFRMIAWITIPLGDTAAGVVSGRFGSAVYFLLAGVVLCCVCILCLVMRLYRLTDAAPKRDEARVVLGV